MKYLNLGQTDLKVSQIALGTAELGMDYGIRVQSETLRPTEAEAERLLHEALDLGVNLIDTARLYGDSEAIIGTVLKKRRREFVLASKVASFSEEDLHGDALRVKVAASVEESLRALQTDVIDLMQIHSAPLSVIQRGEMLDILRDLQKQGSIRHVGATVYAESAEAALRQGLYDCLQIAYNALDREPETFVLPSATQQKVGIVVRSVLLKGALTYRSGFLPDGLSELRIASSRLHRLAEAAGMTLPELAYRYVLSHPGDLIALVGTARLSELEAAIRYAERGPLPDDLLAGIRAIDIRDRAQLNPGNWPPL